MCCVRMARMTTSPIARVTRLVWAMHIVFLCLPTPPQPKLVPLVSTACLDINLVQRTTHPNWNHLVKRVHPIRLQHLVKNVRFALLGHKV